jgi:hypothetical protein
VQKIGQGIVEGKKFAQIQKNLAQKAPKLANYSRGQNFFVQNGKKLDKEY